MTLHKIFLALVFSLTTVSFAEQICEELCPSCLENLGDDTCGKIDSICSCQTFLDSLNTAKAARQKVINESKNKLFTELNESCQEAFCTRTINFNDGVYKGIEKASAPNALTAEKEVAKVNQTAASQQTKECSDLCSNCPISERDLEYETAPVFENPLCQKIEDNCGCFNVAKQNRILAKQAEQDSIKKIEEKLLKIDNAKNLTDTLHLICNKTGTCAVQVSIHSSNFTIASMQVVEAKAKEKNNIAEVQTESTNSVKRRQIFYKGFDFTLGIGQKDPLTFIDYSDSQYDADVISGGITFLFRWDITRVFSIQTGAGFFFNYLETEIIDDYHYDDYYYRHSSNYAFYPAGHSISDNPHIYSLALEFPTSIKIKIPLTVAPFLMLTHTIRFPFVYMGIGHESLNLNPDNDTENLFYIGVGVDLGKIFSIASSWRIFEYTDEFETSSLGFWRLDFSILW